MDADKPTEKHKKLLKNLEEFETYIRCSQTIATIRCRNSHG